MALDTVYSYDDYRAFLRDYYAEQKRINPRYSFRVFAQRAGLGSPNYLKLVIDGQRSLTVTTIHLFAEVLGLNQAEHVFFETLVLLNQAEDERSRRYYALRLRELHEPRGGRQLRFFGGAEMFEHEYFPAIVLALDGLPEAGATAAVAERLSLAPDLVAQGLAFAADKGILRLDGGRYVLAAEHYVFHAKAANVRQKEFLRRQLQLSSRLLETGYDSSHFFAHTFTASAELIPKCEAMIRELAEKLSTVCQGAAPEQIRQLNMQLLRLDDR